MADGEIMLTLDDETTRRLQEAADAAGRPLSDYVSALIADHVAADDDWAEDVQIADDCDASGDHVGLEEGLRAFEDDLEARLAAKA